MSMEVSLASSTVSAAAFASYSVHWEDSHKGEMRLLTVCSNHARKLHSEV